MNTELPPKFISKTETSVAALQSLSLFYDSSQLQNGPHEAASDLQLTKLMNTDKMFILTLLLYIYSFLKLCIKNNLKMF